MLEFRENIILSEFSNYKIGGPAKFFFEAKDVDGIKWAVDLAKKRKLDVFILGAGTNLLIDDRGYDGLVLRPAINFLEVNGEFVKVGAGVKIAELLDFTVKNGLSGLEWAGGLPGMLGGAIRGNAGAFRGEVKDVVSSVESFNTKSYKTTERSRLECNFGYRSSIFKKENGEEIILAAMLSLKKGNPKKIAAAIQEKIDYRARRHPMDYPNVGSVFKNVDLKKIPKHIQAQFASVIKEDPMPLVPTAFLISEAGLKGVSFGGAMVSPKHPNFIVNALDAKADDVKRLIALVKKEVAKKFGIELEEEIQLV